MSKFKKILPLILLTLFISIIFYYYKKNESDFIAIQQLDQILLFQILFLCFLYLLTEGLILKNIVTFLGKNIYLFQSFLIMNATYFCNTFIQFSGLGYRVYYLKKFKNLKISEILRYSIDTIVCELFIFSLIGLVSILFIDLYSEEIKISNFLYIVFTVFFLSSLIYLSLAAPIILIIKSFLNKLNISLFDKIFQIFLIKKENYFSFCKKQFLIFATQYIILFFIFFLVLKKINIENYTYLSLLITSLVDFSFLIALTPYSVGISEFFTFMGTRDIPLSFAEIIILINIFRICMLSIYFICGPIFILINLRKKKYGM
jgi:uncharacterized membrane protein YbhN (UPF0104 family)